MVGLTRSWLQARTRLGIIAVCVLSIFVAVAILLRITDDGVSGTNGVRPAAFVGAVAAKAEVCQTLGTAKRRPSAALVTLGTNGVGPQRLLVSVSGTAPRLAVSGWEDGVVRFPLPPAVRANDPSQMLCIRNAGKFPVQLAGENFPSATLDGRPQPFALSVTLVGARRSWGAQARGVLARVGSAQAGAGGRASGWIVVVLYAAAVLVALGGAYRWAR